MQENRLKVDNKMRNEREGVWDGSFENVPLWDAPRKRESLGERVRKRGNRKREI